MSFSYVYIGNPYHSYGYSSLKLGEALAEADCEFLAADLLPEVGGLRDGGDWKGEPWRFEGTALAFVLPAWLPHIRAERVIVFTMFEGRGLPRERVALVNEHADLCLVPSRWCAEAFVECGVEVPVEVVPLGVDPAEWPFAERAHEGTPRGLPYRFLWNGMPDVRKGWDLVYSAFWEAFRGSDQVELVLHFREKVPVGQEFGDGNVRVITGYQSQSILRRMLHAADCYVFPSRAEGWGLPPREAACTGLPVIATDYGGLAEGIEHWALPVRACRETPTRFKGSEDEPFLIAEPCARDLAERMRWCFEHQEEARRFGLAASEWLAEHGSWGVTARGVRSIIDGI